MAKQLLRFKDYRIYLPQKWEYITDDLETECLVYRDRKRYELLFRLTWLEARSCLKASSHWRIDYRVNYQTKTIIIDDIPEFTF